MNVLSAILRRLRRRSRCAAPVQAGGASAEARLTARALADALDRAMEMGHWNHAHRLAETATRLSTEHPLLADRLARLRLSCGDAESAMALIDACGHSSASLRLLRNACLIQLGQKDEAHTDLYRWSKESTAPLDARLLLACLEWEAGDVQAAISALQRNLHHLNDSRSLEMLLMLTASMGRRRQADTWARRLHECCGALNHESDFAVLLGSLGLTRAPSTEEPAEVQVNALAMELLLAEPVIGALVEAQCRQTNQRTGKLLISAIENALPELSDPRAADMALTRLKTALQQEGAAESRTEREEDQIPSALSLARFLQQFPTDADRDVDVRAVIGRITPEDELPREKAA